MRLGLSMPSSSPDEFLNRLKTLAARFPNQPIYWLRESDALTWYYPSKEQLDRLFTMQVLQKIVVQADGYPDPIPVYLIRLMKKRHAASAQPKVKRR